jgi:integrase
LELLLETVLGISPASRDVVLPPRSLSSLQNVYGSLRALCLEATHHLDVFSVSFIAVLFQQVSAGLARPAYRCDELRRLINLLVTAFVKPMRLMPSISREVIRLGTSAFPALKKAFVDVPAIVRYLRSSPIPSDYLALRDRCILLYLLCSGRRPSNAVAARVPIPSNIWPDRAILFREMGAKNDPRRSGNYLLLDSASVPEVDPVGHFQRLFALPTFIELVQDYRSRHPGLPADLTPLFLYRVTRGNSVGHAVPLKADSCSKVVSRAFAAAGCSLDPMGTTVLPKFIRMTQYTRMRMANVPDVIAKLTGAWSVSDVGERYYFSPDGRPKGLTDFLLHLSDLPPISLAMNPAVAIESWLSPANLSSGLSPSSLGPRTISGRSE